MKLTRKKLKVEVPSVAMGDIAFNLLVFFVILARAQDDRHLQWTPARARSIETAAPAAVRIAVDKNNDLFFNGMKTSVGQLKDLITERLGDLPAGKRTVWLKVHDETAALRFEPVIEAISGAGGELVHILDEEKE